MHNDDLTWKMRLVEFKYWNFDRRAQKFIPWVARHIPDRIKYFVIVNVAVRCEPNNDPSGLTAVEMLKFLNPENK